MLRLEDIGNMSKIEDYICFYDLADLAPFSEYNLDYDNLSEIGAEIETVLYQSFDIERSIKIGLLVWEDEMIGVIILAGRGKDGGEFYIHNKKGLASMLASLFYQQIMLDEDIQTEEFISDQVNGYLI